MTQAATDELAVNDVERASRRSQRHVGESTAADDLADAGDALQLAMDEASPGRFDEVPEGLKDALVLVRDAARACSRPTRASPRAREEADAGRTQARGMVQEVFVTAERMAAGSDADVLWLNEGGDRIPPRLCVAPLQVWGQMRDKLLSDKTAIFTSATLMLGGDFSAMAVSVGLKPAERVVDGEPVNPSDEDVAALARHGRRVAVRLRPPGDPLRRPPPADARSRRPRQGPARRDRRAGRRRRGPHAGAVQLTARGGDGGRRGTRRGCRT